MKDILIGTKNPHKIKKLSWIVGSHYNPVAQGDLDEAPETKDSFRDIAEEKALFYSEQCGCLVISTDGGAVIPALPEWKPTETKRFAATDEERIHRLLEMMDGKDDRTVEWHEAIAVADGGKLLFSAEAKAMDGQMDEVFNPDFYREGIWLCSITSFPKFGNRNFFELSDEEMEATEDSWGKLKKSFEKFMRGQNK